MLPKGPHLKTIGLRLRQRAPTCDKRCRPVSRADPDGPQVIADDSPIRSFESGAFTGRGGDTGRARPKAVGDGIG